MESLEPRMVLSATPMISEFLADNETGLADSNGNRWDWIELYNAGNESVVLGPHDTMAAWKLKCGNSSWSFPSGYTLGPNEFKVVFATGKNPSPAPAEVWADFKLDKGGEDLRLVSPSGQTVSQYSPYPSQQADVSYGIGQQVQETSVVASGASARYLAPSNGSLGLNWTSAAFDDSAWATGTTGLGFAADVAGLRVLNYQANVGVGDLDTALSVLNNPALQTAVYQETTPVYNYRNTGSGAHFGNDRTYPGLTLDAEADDFVTYATGKVHIPAAGDWTFGVNSDDGFQLQINGQTIQYPWGRGPADTLGVVYFDAAGDYPLSLLVFQGYGGAESEFFAAPGKFTGYSQTSTWRLVGDTANGGLAVTSLPLSGNGTSAAFVDLVATDVRSAVRAAGGTSLYSRIAFNVADPTSLDSLTLKMRYDDGYVAWLNGVEIARRNAPASVAYNSVATTERTDAQATISENIDASAYLGLLNATNNVLAIQVLASSANDDDLLILPELAEITGNNSGNYYFASPTPGSVNSQDHWYPVDDTKFSVDHGIFYSPVSLAISSPTSDAAIRYTLNGTEPSDNGRERAVSMLTRDWSTATAYCQSHGFSVGDSVRISGAQQVAYNGLFTVTAVTADTFSYTVNGSPVSPATGAFKAVLDKLRSVAGITLAGSTATVTTAAAHGYATGNWVRIAGAEQPQYNGVFPVTVLNDTQFTCTVTGTPVTPASGAMTADLDNTRSVQSITASGPTATATLPGHGYVTGDMVLIAGADQAEYNGAFVITVLDANQFTYATLGAPLAPAGGSITAQANCYTYTGPMTIAKTTTVRAAAYKAGYAPSDVDTQTYVFPADVIRQSPSGAAPAGWPTGPINNQILNYGMDPDVVNDATWGPQVVGALTSLPTISIVTALPNLFNYQSGIYVNPGQDSEQWERPASVELINPDGSEGFQVNAGLRVRGGASRSTDNPKHAFRLLFKEQYGDAKLNYPLFGDDGVDTFDAMDLRCSQNYSWSFGGDGSNAEIREVFARDTQLAMGQVSTHSRFYHLYIDGQYWGLYQTQERAEASFAASYYGGSEDDYDCIKVGDGYNITATDGSLDAWQSLWNMAQAGFADAAAYYHAQGLDPVTHLRDPAYPVYVDVDNVIDYMMGILYGGDLDAPISNFLGNYAPNNWYGVRNRDGNSGFKFFRHDAEHTLSRSGLYADRNGPWPAGSDDFYRSSPQYLHEELMANADYRMRFADLAQKYLTHNGVLTPQQAIASFKTRAEQLGYSLQDAGPMVAESARWGDSKTGTALTKDNWLDAVNNEIDNYFPYRTDVLLGQLKNTVLPSWRGGTAAPLYPSVDAPEYNQYGGTILPGFVLTMTGEGTIYYSLDGTDPRLPGGAIRSGATVYSKPITLSSSTRVVARCYSGGQWSALSDALFAVDLSGSARITEIMYHPGPATAAEQDAGYTTSDFEYLEFRNVGSQSLPWGGLQVVNGVDFTFPTNRPGTATLLTVNPGQYVLVVANEAAFRLRHPDFTGLIAGQFSTVLSDAGEKIELAGPDGSTIQEFSYGDGWYDITDGDDFSLTVRSPLQALALWDSHDGWRSSMAPGGSPGYDDSLAAPGSVVVNEVLAHSDLSEGDFIELKNVSTEAVDVGGWFVSDDAADLLKYQIRSGTVLQPGAYLVLTQTYNFGIGSGDTGSRTGFGLSEHGDDIYLASAALVNGLPAAGGYREHVDFGATPNGYSVGLYTKSTGGTDFTLLATPTFGTLQNGKYTGAANSDPYQSPLVASEIMYHPADATLAERAAGYSTSDFEYLELYNRSGQSVTLNQFTVSGGIGYTFGWLPGDVASTPSEAVWTQESGATATWTAAGLGSNNTYRVYAVYKLNDADGNPRDLDDLAQYTVTYKNGTQTVTVDQDNTDLYTVDADSTVWVDLGSYTFGSTGSVVLTRSADAEQDDATIADRVVFRRAGSSDKVFDNPTLNSPWMQTGITSLAPGKYVVLTANKAAFDARYHIAANNIAWAGGYSGHLSDSGDSVNVNAYATEEADDLSGFVSTYKLDHVDFGDSPPNWPSEPDGSGASLVRKQPDWYANDPSNWEAGGVPGTPGAANSIAIDRTPPTAPAGLTASRTFVPGRISLHWSASTDPESGVNHYLVYRDGLPIAVTSSTSYLDTSVAASLDYAYQVSAVNRDTFESARSAELTMRIAHIVSSKAIDATHARIVFSEALTASSAQAIGNYTFSGGALSAASLSSDGTTVTLTTSADMALAGSYTVAMSNLATVSGDPFLPGLHASFVYEPTGSGSIQREYWTGINGNAVSNLTSYVNYPNNPTGTSYPTSFEGPTNWAESYGTRMRGYVHPPVSGSYVFWIASDDNGELWLSTDENPANKVRIAYVSSWTSSRGWTTYAEQQSVAISLVAGRKYYIEALQKEGGGGDNLAVRWQLPGGAWENNDSSLPIPGIRLSPYDDAPPSATLGPVTPDPRGTSVNSISIVFSEAVDGLDLADLSLTRGGANLLSAAQTLSTSDHITWTLGNLGGLTAAAGSYVLSLTAAGSGIADMAGNAMSQNASAAWTVILGEIHGYAWNDLDGDAIRDSGEPALSARTIYVDANQNGKFDSGEASAQTNASGYYAIAGLPSGENRVAQAAVSGWDRTFPSGGFHTVDLGVGEVREGVDFGSYVAPTVLDVDNNGVASGMTDGLVILRYLFDFRGKSMTAGVLGNNAQRTDPDELVAYLERARASMLDVDLDENASGMTDGLLVLRYLFDFRGKALTAGVLGPNAQRTDPAEIAQVLDSVRELEDESEEDKADASGDASSDSKSAAKSAPRLAITEINYNPYPPTDTELLADPALQPKDFEFVEITNLGDAAADLTGDQLTGGITFDFVDADVSSLAPGESLLLVGNRPAFELRYGTTLHFAGKFTGQLNNAGEQITLLDGAGLTIVDLTFDDENGWPTEPDGNGPTLELADPDADPNTPAAWTSGAVGGTPGSWTDPRTSASIDVDDNGAVAGITDGVMIVRYLFDFRGDSLTHGALGNAAQRTDPAEIAAYLGTVLPQVLDVDEDNSVRGITDGVLLLRYCFEFRGEPLTHGALGDGAQRTDPAEIAAYLEACCQAKSSSATTLDAKGKGDSPEAAMRSLRRRFHDRALEDFQPEDLGSLLARRRR